MSTFSNKTMVLKQAWREAWANRRNCITNLIASAAAAGIPFTFFVAPWIAEKVALSAVDDPAMASVAVYAAAMLAGISGLTFIQWTLLMIVQGLASLEFCKTNQMANLCDRIEEVGYENRLVEHAGDVFKVRFPDISKGKEGLLIEVSPDGSDIQYVGYFIEGRGGKSLTFDFPPEAKQRVRRLLDKIVESGESNAATASSANVD